MSSEEAVPVPAKRAKAPARSPSVSQDDTEMPFSLATLGLQRVGTAPPPRPPQQPIQQLNARGMPARIRKRNRFFFDDELINDDKPLRMSLSPRKTPLKAVPPPPASKRVVTPPPPPPPPPAKVLSKRKGIASRYMRPPPEVKKRPSGGKASAVVPKVTVSTRASTSKATKTNTKSARTATKTSGGAKATATATATSSSTATATAVAPNQKGAATKKVSVAKAAADSSGHIAPADKTAGQRIGMRLRNLLKLPKAHKWVIYEWFYSFIDKTLFDGENDFQIVIGDSFAGLRTRNLTRFEWQYIRRSIGRPRRCSQAFLDEERRELERKRQKIRYLQTRKTGDIKDISFLRDLPTKIPLPLPVGTKVTARLRIPQDGIFGGTVDAFDSMSSMYRVTFDRVGLGTHSVPDFEIVSENFFEMLPLQSITRDFRPNLMSIFNHPGGLLTPSKNIFGLRGVRSALHLKLNKSDPMLGQDSIDNSPFKNAIIGSDFINGYPAKLLETIVRLGRCFTIKRSKLKRLHDMNNEAEQRVSQEILLQRANRNSSSDESTTPAPERAAGYLSEEFQRRYASIIISLERMNLDMQNYLNDIQVLSADLTRESQLQAVLAPSYLREKCREASDDAVKRNNQGMVISGDTVELIKQLATVLMVASHLSNDSSVVQVSKILEGVMEEVRSSLHSTNIETFQKHVQIHMHHFRLGIGQSNGQTPI